MSWITDAWDWTAEKAVDLWEGTIEAIQNIHEILCGLPQVGPLFDEYPIVAYLIVAASIAGFIWFKVNLRK